MSLPPSSLSLYWGAVGELVGCGKASGERGCVSDTRCIAGVAEHVRGTGEYVAPGRGGCVPFPSKRA